jgi:hypothetical protein
VSPSDDGCAGCLAAPYGLGSTLAVVLSWDSNHALFWALIHGFLSGFYVIYYVIVNWSQIRWFWLPKIKSPGFVARGGSFEALSDLYADTIWN